MAYNDSKGGRPPKSVTLMTPEKVKMAIKSTQSMGQAALYMGESKNTFKKYGKNTSRGLRIKQAEQEKRVVVNPMAIKIKT